MDNDFELDDDAEFDAMLNELFGDKNFRHLVKKVSKKKKSKNINFDKNSIVMPTRHVLRTLRRIYKDGYSNPSSTYYDGQRANELVERARMTVADALGCLPSEIFFTSGSSESIAWVAKNYRILADPRSHHAVLEAEEQSKDNKDAVISFPLIISETGECLEADYDLDNNKDAQFFVDLTQAIGKKDINLSKYPCIKFACASGQKIGGIVGTGILFIKKEMQDKMKPLIYGSQEMGFRGGTTNLPGIICFAEAIKEATKNREENTLNIAIVMAEIMRGIDNYNVQSDVNEDGFYYEIEAENPIRYRRNGNTINITFNNLAASVAVQVFDKFGFNISAGSACTAGSEEPPQAYLKSGYTRDEAMRTIRVSIDKNNTVKEAKKFIKVLRRIINEYDEKM